MDNLLEECAQQELIAVVGPTASGKSDFAVDLALQIDEQYGRTCEIINADAYQLYKGMDIGTAKITNEEMRGVSHHLLDVFEPSESVSVAQYQQLCEDQLAEVRTRGNLPILCGGSGLYIRSITDELNFPATDPEVRRQLEQEADLLGVEAMYARLQELDPASASTMQSENIRRIIRALEVIEITGEPATSTLPEYTYKNSKTLQVSLRVPREQLDAKIELRVAKMKEAGLLAEVQKLAPTLGLTAVRAIGYAELLEWMYANPDTSGIELQSLDDSLIEYITMRYDKLVEAGIIRNGEYPLDIAFNQIAIHTKQLVRKQESWFMRDPRIVWL